MKVLLDENMAHKLRHALWSLHPVTVQYMGWSGLRNGELLQAAEEAGFDVFVTGDKTLQYEQNINVVMMAIVSLSAPHWQLVKEHIEAILSAIKGAGPGAFVRVDVGSFSRGGRKP
jgi:alkanesulfonate monooxygenase SsuD/methylene tetrahydromethanopterin reductase-like flavin-dependent oxidoreductase (luciferase family)